MKWTILFFILPILLFSCDRNEVKKIDKFYFEKFKSGSVEVCDTTSMRPGHGKHDALIRTLSFTYFNQGHQIRIYNNDHNAPIDGDHTIIELDDIGEIYSVGHSRNIYIRWHSTNDSLEKLISVAIDHSFAEILNKPLVNNHQRYTRPFTEVPELP